MMPCLHWFSKVHAQDYYQYPNVQLESYRRAIKSSKRFESHLYFAPCLLAAGVSVFTLIIVAFVFNESHPRWANLRDPARPQLPPPSLKVHASRVRKAIHLLDGVDQPTSCAGSSSNDHGKAISTASREMPPYEIIASAKFEAEEIEELAKGPSWQIVSLEEAESPSNIEEHSKEDEHSACEKVTPPSSSPVFTQTLDLKTCRSQNAGQSKAVYPQEDSERHQDMDVPTSATKDVSPSMRLYLVLSIYTFLVLNSILIGEFLMLYTQSPVLRGGLQFSAKRFGQLLTIRGIIKLIYTMFGYPKMIDRWGLLRCLQAGILTIGLSSLLGFGVIVPWIVKEGLEHQGLIVRLSSGTRSALTTIPDTPRQIFSPDSNTMGAGAVLMTICAIAVGDALGYISVLVLGRTSNAWSSRSSGQYGIASSSANGVLWGVAQVTTNFMRLAGPVIAGLLWSLAVQSSSPSEVALSTGVHKHPPVVGVGSASSANGQPDAMSIMRDHVLRMPSASWTSTLFSIVRGPTNVFFLVGGIGLFNYLQSLYVEEQADQEPARPPELEQIAEPAQSSIPDATRGRSWAR
ncbi:hypothetical protein BGZ73_003245 [Actinomortierella ambigua]|nr:hypothetical protein BGZ73_003245 [Actinomortierella ambigua]